MNIIIEFFRSPISFHIFSIFGASAAIIGSFVAGIGYRGKDNEAYSPLNHFISELGEVGVSRLAWAFNLGLILSGVSLIPASISLGLILPGLLAKLGMIAGIICSIALALVGIFPMNNIESHGRAAVAYFRSGLLMMIFFNLAIGMQQGNAQIIPKSYSLAGLPAILSFAIFLVLMGKSRKERDNNPLSLEEMERPKIWLFAIVEWSIFITIVIWFVVIAIGL